MSTLYLSTEAEADELLAQDPLALLVGMLLDQQVPMEWAFTSPYRLAQRLGTPRLDAAMIAAYDPELLAQLFAQPPALHRFPTAMATRTQRLCKIISAEYGGDAAAVWRDARTGQELLRRVGALPGFGRQKAQIFTALLGKQLGVRPPGWREAAGEYGEEGVHRSVADITDAESLARVRTYKQQQKAAARAAKAAARGERRGGGSSDQRRSESPQPVPPPPEGARMEG
ncbi:MAG TPA: HhH-GPD-type base excision DNA repair protein [Natronosporangium sp.]|nr:HhH-GPD-type base excision DNA repair protein [Natronosporangium sp.]